MKRSLEDYNVLVRVSKEDEFINLDYLEIERIIYLGEETDVNHIFYITFIDEEGKYSRVEFYDWQVKFKLKVPEFVGGLLEDKPVYLEGDTGKECVLPEGAKVLNHASVKRMSEML